MDYADSFLRKLRPEQISSKIRAEARKLLAPYAVQHTPLRKETFTLWGQERSYFLHPHNTTWLNERSVEIPAAISFLQEVSGQGMEFGNVLSHYGIPGPTEVVDKYEKRSGVKNMDIVDYWPKHELDFIISVSTLEHVGWDERPRDPNKVDRAFKHLVKMLAPSGRLLLTMPLGYNPAIDAAAIEGRWPMKRQTCLLRDHGRWTESRTIEWRPYGRKGRGADSVWVAEFHAGH